METTLNPKNLITKRVEDFAPGITLLKFDFSDSSGRQSWVIRGTFSPGLEIHISVEPKLKAAPITMKQVHIAVKNLQWILKDGRMMGFKSCLFHQEKDEFHSKAYSWISLTPKSNHPIWSEILPDFEDAFYWDVWGC